MNNAHQIKQFPTRVIAKRLMSKVIGVVDVAKHSLDACLMKQRFDISKIQNVVLHDEVNRMELDSNVVNSLTKACASQRINISLHQRKPSERGWQYKSFLPTDTRTVQDLQYFKELESRTG